MTQLRPTVPRSSRSPARDVTREGRRREWSFGEVSALSSRLAALFEDRGVRRGDIVMTVIGNRPDWVLTLVACFRIGSVATPCNEQLRAKDLRVRLQAARPKLIVADERNAHELAEARPGCEVVAIPDERLHQAPGRTDDLIISAGYRIGPFEVESALVSHPAVAETAVVAAPDDERGSVVRAVVVLRGGFAASDALASELQKDVQRQTAPCKNPRIVEFAPELPKTASGEVKRAVLRGARAA